MPLLQVRDCPEDLYKKISYTAKRQNRTIAQQVLVLLEKGLGQNGPNKERRKQLLEFMKNREIPKSLKDVNAVQMIREDRER